MKNLYGYTYGGFSNRTEAKRLMSDMQNIINKYGSVTIADLHDLLGLDTDYTTNRIGWTDLNGTDLCPSYFNGWTITFKEPKDLIKNSSIIHYSGRYPWGQKEFNEDKECNEEMVVYKKCKMMVHTRDIKVGDQIDVPLDGIGTFTATAHQITDEGILFIFNDCITCKQMNSNGGNKGGFEKSELIDWMGSTLYDAFPEELKKRLRYITLPSYGQMFGHDEWYEKAIEPDKDEQLPLMKIRRNRICTYENDNCWYWLRNATKKNYSSDGFAGVNDFGYAVWDAAGGDGGVRPAFLIG